MKLFWFIVLSSFIAFVLCEEDEAHDTKVDEDVEVALPSFSKEDFDDLVPDDNHFIMFYAPWCGHCQRLKPVWEELFRVVEEEEDYDIEIAKVDCTVETRLCSDEGVLGYPTLKLYQPEKDAERYKGARDLKSLLAYINEKLNAVEEAEEDLATPEDGLYELTGENFEKHIETGKHFIKFFAPWCGHCKRLEPVWSDLAKAHKPSEDTIDEVKIGRVDCTKNRDVCGKYEVRGYPTLLWFDSGKMTKKYQSGSDINSFERFIKEMTTPKESVDDDDEDDEEDDDDDTANVNEGLYDLSEHNFKSHISNGYHLIKFYAPWCGHCKRMEPTWITLAKSHVATDDKPDDVKIGRVDCTKNQATCSEYGVRGYPTILWFKDGEKVENYQGPRQLTSFESYIAKMISGEADEEEPLQEEEEVKEEVKPTPSPVFNEKEDADENEAVAQLDENNFEFGTALDVTFVMFYAPWCGFCNRLAPTWEELAVEDFTELGELSVKIAKVDCTKNQDICQKYEVRGYPTLILFKDGENVSKYSGNRSKEDLKTFIVESVSKKPVQEKAKDEL